MTTRKSAAAGRLPMRRGLVEAEAALYIGGLGATKFAELVKAGHMPRPRLLAGRRVWDVDELDAAFRSLPVEGAPDENEGPNPWH